VDKYLRLEARGVTRMRRHRVVIIMSIDIFTKGVEQINSLRRTRSAVESADTMDRYCDKIIETLSGDGSRIISSECCVLVIKDS
jgi:hypothetical protein